MKKGICSIITGVVLIILQILSLSGNAKAGNAEIRISFNTVGAFFHSLSYAFGYLLVGIIGVILLIYGINSCRKKN